MAGAGRTFRPSFGAGPKNRVSIPRGKEHPYLQR